MTVTRARWFPASVVLPSVGTVRRAFVVLGQGGDHDGLHVWLQPEEEPAYRYAVNWAATRIPTGPAARGGIEVRLADGGLAVVTVGGGCRCGALGRWNGPSWIGTVTG